MNCHTNKDHPCSPLHIPAYMNLNRPPPTPRDMYAKGIMDEQRCKHAPPPPKRNPETKLSSSSTAGQSGPVWPQCNPYHQLTNYRTPACSNRCSSPPLPLPPTNVLEVYSYQHSLSYVPQSIPEASGNQSILYNIVAVGGKNERQQQFQQQQQRQQPSPAVAQPPPPPPPVSSIPKKKIESENSVPKNLTVTKMGGKSNVLTMGGNSNVLTMGGNCNVLTMGGNANVQATSRDGHFITANGLMQQISKVKLNKTGIRLAPGEPRVPDDAEAVTQVPRQSDDVSLNGQSSFTEQRAQVFPILDKFERQRNTDGKGENHNKTQDLSEIPGYTPMTKSTPIWKKDIIEKKNQENIQKYVLKLVEEEQKATIKEQRETETEKETQEEPQDVPEWKREIIMKRGGEIRNWKDERDNS